MTRQAFEWKHDDLLEDLAGFLRGPSRMVWTDMQLGPSGSPRPDVYTLQKSYSKPLPSAYEVKVSKSDLRSDTKSGKWQSYLKFAGSVTFAIPDGLCVPSDIPPSCGLIVRKDETWRYARKPIISRVEIPDSAYMKLLIDGVSRAHAASRCVPRTINTWSPNEAVRKRFGDAVAIAARDLTAAQSQAAALKNFCDDERERVRLEVSRYKEQAINAAKTEIAGYALIKREICDWLGIEGETSKYGVEAALRKLRDSLDSDKQVAAAEARLSAARRAIESAAYELKVER